ncbi:MAG: flagellin domain protein [Thermoleophilia bacterium]|nr:flagellin domain protein [Thermoleophilia bacterium]
MGLRINTNVDAFASHRTLAFNSDKLSKSMEKLSSGFRINRAGDDAAGLGISERMRGQINGVAQAQRNAQDGISLVQTAEGAMQELHSILHRVRDLAVQYQNGVNGPEAKMAITTEVAQLSAELGRMIQGANFNGISLLNTAGTITLQVGPNNLASDSLAFQTVDLTAMTAQSTGNPNLATVMTNFNTGTTASMATTIADIDDFVNGVSKGRAAMGAIQNRLEHTVNALSIYQENLMAAESRIRDVDMAAEMTNFTKLQILQQSGTAMLAQANMSSQSVLSLLQG